MSYFEDIAEMAEKLDHDRSIHDVVKVLEKAREAGRQVFIAGNGGSAGTASHMAADLCKMAEIKAISLVENASLMTALINDDGWEELYIEQLERFYNRGDILITLSVHGGKGTDKAGKWSQNLMKAINYVKDNGGTTIALTGFDGGAMLRECDFCINVPAESTPVVESMHVVLHHYITFALYKGHRK